MEVKYHKVIQGSEEWFALRLKYPLTASHAQAIATGYGRRNYKSNRK